MRQPKKRISPTEHIANSSPDLESAHVKTSGHAPIDVFKDRERDAVDFDDKKVQEYLTKTSGKFYTAIHTHRTGWWQGNKKPKSIPSMPDDLYFFLKNEKERFMGIAEQHYEDGSVSDYILFKKKRHPTEHQLKEREMLIGDVEKNYKKPIKNTPWSIGNWKMKWEKKKL